jgi:hypothetical protein
VNVEEEHDLERMREIGRKSEVKAYHQGVSDH